MPSPSPTGPRPVARGPSLRDGPAPPDLLALTNVLWKPARPPAPPAPGGAPLKRLVYSSRAVGPMTARAMAELLDAARRRNARANVTGVLLHHAGGLLQCVEGPMEAVEALYTGLVRDRRHCCLVLLVDERIDERVFTSWYMGHGEIGARAWGELSAAPWPTDPAAAFAHLVRTWNALRVSPAPGAFADAGPPGY